jgi:hypothetical protein
MHVGKERTAGALYRHAHIMLQTTQNFGRVPVKFVFLCSSHNFLPYSKCSLDNSILIANCIMSVTSVSIQTR